MEAAMDIDEKENCASRSSSSFNNSEPSGTISPHLCDASLKPWNPSANFGTVPAIIGGHGGPTAVSQIKRSSWSVVKIVEGRLVQPRGDDENEIGPQIDRSQRSRRQEDAGGSERSKRRRKIVNQNASDQVASNAFELISNAVVYSCFLFIVVCAPLDIRDIRPLFKFTVPSTCISKPLFADRSIISPLLSDVRAFGYSLSSKNARRNPTTPTFDGDKDTGVINSISRGFLLARQPGLRIVDRNTLVMAVTSVEDRKERASAGKEFVEQAREPGDNRSVIDCVPSLPRQEPITTDLEQRREGGTRLQRCFDDRKWVGASGASKRDDVHRTFRAIVAERLHSVEGLASAVEWSHVFFDVVEAYNCIYEKGCVLHRDVSINNIIFRRKRDNVYGTLVDFDFGSSYHHHLDKPNHHSALRTGTMPFLAYDLHEKPSSPHLYRHDLESFFYVFIFVVCSHDFVTDEQGRRRLHRNEKKGIVEWLRHDNDRLQGEKLLMFLMKPKFRRTVKAKEWDEDFKVLTACLVSMYNSFRESSLSGTDGASSDSGDETDKTGGEEDETRSPFRHVSYDLFVKAKAKLPFSIL